LSKLSSSFATLSLVASWVLLVSSWRPAAAESAANAVKPLILRLTLVAASERFDRDDALKPIQEALIKQGTAAIGPLRKLLQSSDLRIGDAAATVLENFDDPKVKEAVISYALRALVDPSSTKKEPLGPGFQHLEKLGKAALPAMVKAYTEMAKKPLARQNPRYLLYLAEIAAELPDRAGRPLLSQALQSPWYEVVSKAAQMIGAPGDQAAYELLIPMLNPRNVHCSGARGRFDYRLGVVGGLAVIGNRDAVEPLYHLLMSLDLPPSDQPASMREEIHPSLQKVIRGAIAKLTGEDIGKDSYRIEQWIDAYRKQRR